MEDEKRLRDAGIRGDMKNHAFVEEGVAERSEEMLRMVPFCGSSNEGALDALRRGRQNVLHALEEDSGGEVARKSPEETPVHERQPRLRSREPDRSEPRFQLEGGGALGERDIVRQKRERRTREGREVREPPLLVVRRGEAEPLERRDPAPAQFLQPERAVASRGEVRGRLRERRDSLVKGRWPRGARSRPRPPRAGRRCRGRNPSRRGSRASGRGPPSGGPRCASSRRRRSPR